MNPEAVQDECDDAALGSGPADLVRRIQAGDPAAEAELVARFSHGLLLMLRQLARNPSLADDLHKETLALVLQKIRRGEVREPEPLNRVDPAGYPTGPPTDPDVRISRIRLLVARISSRWHPIPGAERKSKGIEPFGVESILKQNPHTRPTRTKKSPAPLVHAATKAVRQAFWEAYATFLAEFRDAAEKLRAGDRLARFPTGSFPPGLPFVSLYPARPP